MFTRQIAEEATAGEERSDGKPSKTGADMMAVI